LQFEVFAQRMELEFSCRVILEPMSYEMVYLTDEASAPALDRQRECEVARRGDGVILALVSTPWRARSIVTTNPELTLLTVEGEPLSGRAA
jgi:peptide subunit release factor RF-3